jgi:hypothetical protein
LTLKTLGYAFRAYCEETETEGSDELLSEFIRSVKFDSWNTGAHFQALLDGRTPKLEANPYAPPASPVVEPEKLTLDFGEATS